jgi:glycosyltransferase involved in cell wall biosynthesis
MRHPSKAPNLTDRPFLSIVTISFNQRQFLQQTLESVLSQKDPDIEYIVVDPGSTDGSRELLERYRGRIDKLIFEPDLGAADGLNKGFAHARGQIGYFLNSDDFLLPHAVETLRTLWVQNDNIDVMLCRGWMVDRVGTPLRELRRLSDSLPKLTGVHRAMVQQGMSFRMELFRQVGGFNSANRTCWDFELLCLFLAASKRVKVSKERIGAFRLHGQSLTGGVAGKNHAERFKADESRILSKYGLPYQQDKRIWNSFTKHTADPIGLAADLADRIIGGRLKRRFHADCVREGGLIFH